MKALANCWNCQGSIDWSQTRDGWNLIEYVEKFALSSQKYQIYPILPHLWRLFQAVTVRQRLIQLSEVLTCVKKEANSTDITDISMISFELKPFRAWSATGKCLPSTLDSRTGRAAEFGHSGSREQNTSRTNHGCSMDEMQNFKGREKRVTLNASLLIFQIDPKVPAFVPCFFRLSSKDLAESVQYCQLGSLDWLGSSWVILGPPGFAMFMLRSKHRGPRSDTLSQILEIWPGSEVSILVPAFGGDPRTGFFLHKRRRIFGVVTWSLLKPLRRGLRTLPSRIGSITGFKSKSLKEGNWRIQVACSLFVIGITLVLPRRRRNFFWSSQIQLRSSGLSRFSLCTLQEGYLKKCYHTNAQQ